MDKNSNITISATAFSKDQIRAAVTEKDGILDWWVKTVIFAFFPIMAAVLISILVIGTISI